MCRKVAWLIPLAAMLAAVPAVRAELIGHWALDETSGTTAADFSGRGHDGTYMLSPSLGIPGVYGTGMNSATGYMQADLGADLPVQAEERTIALWVNTAQSRGDRKFCGYGNTSNGQAFTFTVETVDNQDGIRLRHWGGNMFYPGFTVGQWNHIAVRVPAGATIANNTEVFINGKKSAGYRSSGTDLPLITAATLFYVGTSIGTQAGQVFDGLLDDVFFYDHALADSEILSIMSGKPWPYASGPNPPDGTIHKNTWANFTWKPGDLAVSHNVHLGDNFADVNAGAANTFRGNQSDASLTAGLPGFVYPDGLTPGVTYYWRIDEVNAAEPNSPWKGAVWSLSIAPRTAYSPNPADGAGAVALSGPLTWTPGLGAKLHTVYLGDNFDDVNNVSTGGTMGATATYSPSSLKAAKVYYWRVDETDPPNLYKGQVWSFTTVGAVGSPYPANGATDAEMNAILTWVPGDDAASHQVYFGTDNEAVRKATAASPEYKGVKALGAESFDPGMLASGSTFYWRIDEVNNTNPESPWKGPVWSFATGNSLLVENFESYNDIDPPAVGSNRIFDKWIDGFGTTTNGALVGNNLPPYAERAIVRGGKQSMPLTYDNNLKYSEATMTLSAASRDWTQQGVANLTLWFRGTATNSAEQMYVALNGTAVVYNTDTSLTQKTSWIQWVIPLQQFAGVNLTGVTSLTIGVGTKGNSTVAGGTGKMYFDDIRLSR